jgi:hypothetical protein
VCVRARECVCVCVCVCVGSGFTWFRLGTVGGCHGCSDEPLSSGATELVT